MPQIGFLFSLLLRDQIQRRPSRTMPTLEPTLSLRTSAENPNHHLWNNHGTWFLHYTTHPTPFTKERIRRSLGTKDIKAARARRDRFFAQLVGETSRGVHVRRNSVAA